MVWDLRYDIFLNPLVLVCTLLLVIIPLTIHVVNRYLHTRGDPPWKQDKKNQE